VLPPPETDHVDPPPHPLVGGVFAELPGGVDEPVHVVVDVEVGECFGGDAAFTEAEVLSAFGGVFRDVAGSMLRGQLACWTAIDGLSIELVPKRSTSPDPSGISTVSRTCAAAWRIASVRSVASMLI